MIGQFFSAIGGAIGTGLGGGIFSTICRFAGSWIGKYIEREIAGPDEYYNIAKIKESFTGVKANYGDCIPLVFGKAKLYGQIIWIDQIRSVSVNEDVNKYFEDTGQTRSITHNVKVVYYASFALSICEGTIIDIDRVWLNSELVDISKYNFRLYLGSDEQNPDPLITKHHKNLTPAFKDLAYIVFEDLPLADFNDLIPNFAFEVTRKANVHCSQSVEDMVSSMVIIPGSGEFVYDTLQQYKHTLFCQVEMYKQSINVHNFRNIANSVRSLDQLRHTCSNVQWVSPVVCWFGDSMDIATCNILPAVEFNDPKVAFSEEWSVGGYYRHTAKIISKDHDGNPRYGGSINDASVLRYLQEIKRRGYKIMLYPMFFMDLEGKPWRGHLTGSASSVSDFFNKSTGYNKFITHYARLVRGVVDAFVIGSELIGLTKIQSTPSIFPAVDELIKLATSVKQILGKDTLVTYAADWSEYHHTEGGWYNLDPLWASSGIDFVGIDAYFPITNSINSAISQDEIMRGFQSGEGYEYYIDSHGNTQPLDAPYAWKNLRYWWENIHINPNQQQTPWNPRMKQIWFTEFGFPSIDKATNQPNIFFDPVCVDGGLPKHSSGDTDFAIQRSAIKAFIEYWKTQEYIGRMFLWTWDARPYPAWPHENIWKDRNLWEKGHWVNNKFGTVSLAGIILEISMRCSIPLAQIEVSSIDDAIEGVKFDQNITAFNALNVLRVSHFFDIVTSNHDHIKFTKRALQKTSIVNQNCLIKLDDSSAIKIDQLSTSQIINNVSIYFFDHSLEYIVNAANTTQESFSSKKSITVKLPLVMLKTEAHCIGRLILQNAANENGALYFVLPLNFIQCEPGDFLVIQDGHSGKSLEIRVIDIKIVGLKIHVYGILDKISSYHTPRLTTERFVQPKIFKSVLVLIELPRIFFNIKKEPFLIAYLQSTNAEPLYASLDGDIDKSYSRITTLQTGSVNGMVMDIHHSAYANHFMIDEQSSFIVSCQDLMYSVSDEWNLALCGKELIRFKKAEKLEESVEDEFKGTMHKISQLIRGCFGTEDCIKTHKPGEVFVLINAVPNLIPISNQLIGRPVYYKTSNTQAQSFVVQNIANKPLAPFVSNLKITHGVLSCTLTHRTYEDAWICKSQEIDEYEYIIEIRGVSKSATISTKESQVSVNIAEIPMSVSDIKGVSIITQVGDEQSLPKSISNVNTGL